jgi:hypothetical protein
MRIPFVAALALAASLTASAQVTDSANGYGAVAGQLLRVGLGRLGAYGMLGHQEGLSTETATRSR